ncbi:MAG: spore germination protein [Firmicutes bacterium]|nr:spore germination protein [Bacillota bacterium]
MNFLPRISLMQFFVLCFISSFGVSMSTLPRSVAESAKEDMWLAVVVGGVAFLFTVWAITKLSGYFPQQTCFEYHRILLGSVLGEVANVLLVLLLITVPIISIRSFIVALKIYLLDLTPLSIIAITVLSFITYAGQYGLLPIIRTLQFVFMSSHLALLLIILLGFLAIKPSHYFPFMAQGFMPVLKGAIPSWYSYTGPEFIISCLYPFITRKEKVFKSGVVAVIVLMVVYTLIIGIVQGILGAEESAHMLIPTVIAYRSVEIPDTFIERLDGYFFSLWIPVFAVCMLIWVYLVAFGMKQICRLEYSRPVVVLLGPIILYFINVVPSVQIGSIISEWTNYAFIVWDIGVLPLLIVLAWWKEKRKNIC